MADNAYLELSPVFGGDCKLSAKEKEKLEIISEVKTIPPFGEDFAFKLKAESAIAAPTATKGVKLPFD